MRLAQEDLKLPRVIGMDACQVTAQCLPLPWPAQVACKCLSTNMYCVHLIDAMWAKPSIGNSGVAADTR